MESILARNALILLTVSLSILSACAARAPTIWADGCYYMVAADHVAASRAGADILAAGGNAVDAAVATSFALAVVRPESCGLGGGGFMLIHQPGGDSIVLDYRETAPAAALRDAYLDKTGHPLAHKTKYGAWSVGVPGTVKGLLHALEHYGSGRLTREAVLRPAIELARRRNSLCADRHLHKASRSLTTTISRPLRNSDYLENIRKTFTKEGKPIEIGDIVDRRDMLRPLQAISDGGVAGFYEGEIADRIVATIKKSGGPLSHSDLRHYRVRTFKPLRGRFMNYQILTMPPPSSGGAVILLVLNILSSVGHDTLSHEYQNDDAAYEHRLVSSMKLAFRDRAQLLGDHSPEVMADVKRMIDPEYGRRIHINMQATSSNHARALRTVPNDGGTSHFCVVDRDGMAVACTESINLEFGSRMLVPETGIVLNNTMDDFAVDAETPNAFGLRQSERNLIRPRTRPLSSMSPAIVLKDGQAHMVLGASGGPRIISSTLQTLLHVLVGGKTVDEAIREPRLHHQWRPDCVFIQPSLPRLTLRHLLDRGHAIRYFPKSAGHVQAIHRISPRKWRGACDPDKGGRPAGQ